MLSFRIGEATVKSAPPKNCKTKTDPQQFLLSWCRTPHSPSCSRDDLTVRNEQVCPKINESNGIILWRMIRSQNKNPRCQVSCFLQRAMSMFAVIWVWTPRLQSHFSVNSDRTGQKLSSPVFLYVREGESTQIRKGRQRKGMGFIMKARDAARLLRNWDCKETSL